MQNIEKIKRDFLTECYDDYVGLWSLIRRVKFEMQEEDPQKIRDITMAIVTGYLREGLIKSGIPKITGEFEEWQLSPEKTTERIQNEWDKLGAEPNMGDIVWFTTSEKGDIHIKAKKAF